MTPAQHRRQLVRIIHGWQTRLKLNHIDIEIAWGEEPEDEDALASVSPSDLYDYAELRFRGDWSTHSLRELNRIVVHELLHVMFRDFSSAVRSVAVTGCLTADARCLWHDRCHDTEEGLIDRLAHRFVETGGIIE